ncbi:hypothetical protein [Aeromonas schubertii]|nr:hypothetical protein [Aeromonas schubertii]
MSEEKILTVIQYLHGKFPFAEHIECQACIKTDAYLFKITSGDVSFSLRLTGCLMDNSVSYIVSLLDQLNVADMSCEDSKVAATVGENGLISKHPS